MVNGTGRPSQQKPLLFLGLYRPESFRQHLHKSVLGWAIAAKSPPLQS
jgi:hypothetical protein